MEEKAHKHCIINNNVLIIMYKASILQPSAYLAACIGRPNSRNTDVQLYSHPGIPGIHDHVMDSIGPDWSLEPGIREQLYCTGVLGEQPGNSFTTRAHVNPTIQNRSVSKLFFTES